MNAGNLWYIIKLLPLLALTAVLFGVLGWWLRRKFHAPVVSSHKPQVQDDLPARERVKKLEHALAKSEAAQKAIKHDLETLQAKTVSKQALDKASKELADAQHRLDADLKRIQTLEVELKKTRETLNTLNSATAEANKGQRDRTFVLENELSKTREALAILEARPDNSLGLQAEIDRLRETLTNSTRVIGELRKQESATAQALTKCQAQIEAATLNSSAAETGTVSLLTAMEMAERKPSRSGNSGASDRVVDAQAEVERLNSLNAQKRAERLAAEQSAAARTEQNRLAAEQAAAEAAEQERIAAEKAAADVAEQERLAAEKAAADAAEQERLAAEKAATDVAEQERLAAEKAAAEAAEQERLAAEKADADAAEQEHLAAEKAAAEVAEQERLAAEKAAADAAEQERLAAEKAAADAAEQERLAAEKAAAEAAEQERLAAEKAAAEAAEQERLAAEKAAAEAAEQERLAAEKAAAEAAEQERLAAVRSAAAATELNLFAAEPAAAESNTAAATEEPPADPKA
jgi:fused signal recognition particle receptor